MNSHRMAQRGQEAPREELDMLGFLQWTSAWQECLEPVLVLLHGACAPALRELEEGCRAQGQTETQLEKVLETAPPRNALVTPELEVPQLGHVLKIIRGHPHLLLFHDPLLMEIRFTAADEDERIDRTIIARKIHLLEPRRAIVVVLAVHGPART